MLNMAETGLIKRGHELSHFKVNTDNRKRKDENFNFPVETLHDTHLTIGGKQLSYEMLFAVVNKRFHACLKAEAQNNDKKALYFSYEDYDLVSKVCRRERLTLYNFLKMHHADHNRTLDS